MRIDEEKIAQLEKKSISLDNKIEELYKKKEDTSTLTFKVEKIDENIKTECSKAPIPVIIHNFRGYDSHIVCQSVAKSASAHQVRVIAETFERYKTMKVGQLKYMDSYQFMNSSLSSLANNLGAIKLKHYKNYTKEQIAMVCQKGIYPYEYIDSLERFLKTELPPIEKFNTHLKDNPELQFEWLETIQKTKSDASRGYFVNIKAHFPIGTHDKLKDLPPAVENIAVKRDWLSYHNKEQIKKLDNNRFSSTKKLVTHLGPRDNYVIHYLELQYYVKLGLVIDEVS
ncbi:3262_t:CDS:2 [Entrophospora sp. SA101]|nr:3262_t:CDS:2 [Entrophospora sp. SA101]